MLPILAVWFSTTVLAAVVTRMSLGWGIALGVASIATILLIPGMHHRLKAFQHGYATYGERHFTFRPALVEFYWVYVKGLVLLVLGGILGSLVLRVRGAGDHRQRRPGRSGLAAGSRPAPRSA